MNECTGGRARPGLKTLAAAVLAAASVLTACGVLGASSTQLDTRFVDSVRSTGRAVPHDTEATLVIAARKICARRVTHTTPEERRGATLTSRELDTVAQAFSGDARGFASLALDTYCPS